MGAQETARHESMVFESPRDDIAEMLWHDVLQSLPKRARDKLSIHEWRQTCKVIRETAIRQAEQAAREQALEDAAIACEGKQKVFGSTEYATGQPFSSQGERFACGCCAEAIRALKAQSQGEG